jgi:hypothetical protein
MFALPCRPSRYPETTACVDATGVPIPCQRALVEKRPMSSQRRHARGPRRLLRRETVRRRGDFSAWRLACSRRRRPPRRPRPCLVRTRCEEQAAEGEKVWSRFTWRGTHQGEFLGIPPTSRAVTVKGMVIDRFVDGKWTESRILMDNLGMMQQLGVIPEPGQPGEPEPT